MKFVVCVKQVPREFFSLSNPCAGSVTKRKKFSKKNRDLTCSGLEELT